MKPVHAIFENGVFRPTERVELPERCEVVFEPQVLESRVKHAAEKPSWLSPVTDAIHALGRLRDGWNSYRGATIDSAAMVRAATLLNQIARPGLSAPHVAPTPDGGVQLEWHDRDVDLEIRVRAADPIEVAVEESGDSWEGEFPAADVSRIDAIFSKLMNSR